VVDHDRLGHAPTISARSSPVKNTPTALPPRILSGCDGRLTGDALRPTLRRREHRLPGVRVGSAGHRLGPRVHLPPRPHVERAPLRGAAASAGDVRPGRHVRQAGDRALRSHLTRAPRGGAPRRPSDRG
jgi:hypothetical protein